MDELITSFKAQMYEKARSPFLTAFMVSWFSWNLKTIIIFVGSGNVENKLKLLDGLYSNSEDYLGHWVLYPLLTASAFIFLYPLIAMIAFSYWNFLNNEIKKIQVIQDDKVPTTAEDARKLRKLISEVSIEKQKVIDDLVDKNTELMQSDVTTNNLIAQLESEKRDLIKEMESKDLTISELTKNLHELKKAADSYNAIIAAEAKSTKAQAEEVQALTTFIKDLNFDFNSFNETEKVNAQAFLKLAFKFKNDHSFNTEQMRVLLLLLASEGTMELELIKKNLRVNDIQLKAIIATLVSVDLVVRPIGSTIIRLTDKFQQEAYKLGLLSIANYQNLLIDLLF